MNIKNIFLFIASMSVTTAYGYKFFHHTIFNVGDTPFRSATPENVSLWRMDMNDAREEGIGGSIVIVPFGGTTIGNDLTEYFSPFGKFCDLKVLEYKTTVPSSTVDPNENRDLEARHFNIQTQATDATFRSTISFHIKHAFFGLGIGYRQRLGRHFWLEVSAPIMRVKNTITFDEAIIDEAGGAVDAIGLSDSPRVGNMEAAIRQPAWQYLRLDPDEDRTKWGIADMEFKIGWNSYETDTAHLRTYIGMLIPTGNKPDPRLLFPAVVGNNKHFGLMFGSNIGFIVLEHGNHVLRTELDTNGRYLFNNEQTRTFDLIDKSWSRYMEMYASPGAAQTAATTGNPNSGSFGANLMTFRVKVDPRFLATFNTAIVYSYCDFLIEAGYNFFARQGEKVSICDCELDIEASLKAVSGLGQTTVARTIKDNFAGSDIAVADYKPITCADIDFESAAHPPVINQTFYGTAGYRWSEIRVPTEVALGASYDFSKSNAGVNRWMLWFKTAISF